MKDKRETIPVCTIKTPFSFVELDHSKQLNEHLELILLRLRRGESWLLQWLYLTSVDAWGMIVSAWGHNHNRSFVILGINPVNVDMALGNSISHEEISQCQPAISRFTALLWQKQLWIEVVSVDGSGIWPRQLQRVGHFVQPHGVLGWLVESTIQYIST